MSDIINRGHIDELYNRWEDITAKEESVGQALAKLEISRIQTAEPNPLQRRNELASPLEGKISIPELLLSRGKIKRINTQYRDEGIDMKTIVENLEQTDLEELDQFTSELMLWGRNNMERPVFPFGLATHASGLYNRKYGEDIFKDLSEVDDENYIKFAYSLSPFMYRVAPNLEIDFGNGIKFSGDFPFTLGPLQPPKMSEDPKMNQINKILLKSMYSDIMETVLFLATAGNTEFIGLGGLSGSRTEQGELLDTALMIIRENIKSKFSEEEIKSSFPHLLDAKITTGHVGTIAAIMDTINVSDQEAEERKGRPIAILGAGAVGDAVAQSLAYTKDDRDIVIIEPSESAAAKVLEKLEKAGKGNAKVVSPNSMDSNIEELSEVGTWILCTSGTDFGKDQNHPFYKILKETQNKGIKVMLIDDTWPHVIPSDIMTSLRQSDPNLSVTEVAYHIPQDLALPIDRENGYRVAKPALAEGQGTISYSCEVEPIVLEALNYLEGIGELKNFTDTLDLEEPYKTVAYELTKRYTTQGIIGETQPEDVMMLRAILERLSMNKITYHFDDKVI